MNIVTYPREVLRREAETIEDIDQEIRELADEMTEVLFRVEGVGLAAPQIGVSKKLIVVDLEEEFFILVNPEIIEESDQEESSEEGCLSVPGVEADVIRPRKVVVSGIDLDGNQVELEKEGLAARVFQHEIDHIHGRLFIDHLSTAKRSLLLSEYRKNKGEKQAAAN